ncbi:hypothetical protein [Methylobacterium oryzisoli]|uniref:hypothetical protein n=1 Tax=Methylobacterium oryzisoli TaxID=3385502 RepID=UPI0038913DA2
MDGMTGGLARLLLGLPLLFPAAALAQAAETTVSPGGVRLPQVIATPDSGAGARSDGAVPRPDRVDSLEPRLGRPPSRLAEPPPDPLFADQPAPKPP